MFEIAICMALMFIPLALGFFMGKHHTECWAYEEIGRLTELSRHLTRELRSLEERRKKNA